MRNIERIIDCESFPMTFSPIPICYNDSRKAAKRPKDSIGGCAKSQLDRPLSKF